MKLEELASLEEALNSWRDKRDFFELEKVQTADPEQKYSLHRKIKECDENINRLEAEISERQKKANNSTSLPFQIPFILPQKDVSSFTGRDEELLQLQELLIHRQGTKLCSIAGLAGTGGIGKSALACHFATLHKADFPDGVIGLRVDGKDADTIARDFARRCGEEVEPEDERDAKTIMQDVFAHRRILLIFDNAEDANIIKELYPDGERCAVIITTRDRFLSISLDIPDRGRIEVKPLSKPESLLLLQKLLSEKRIAAEPQISEEIIELAGYLPLALQIIGAALKLNPNRLDDKRQEAIGLNCLGGVLQQQKKLNEAVNAFRRSIEINQQLNAKRSEAIGLNCLGNVLQQQNKLDEAVNAFRKEIKINQQLDDKLSEGIAFNRLGGVLQQQNKLDEAVNAFRCQIEISQQLDDKRQEAIGLNCLGGVLQQQKKLDEAVDAFRRVVKISQQLDDKRQEVIGLNCLGHVLQQQNKLDEAVDAFRYIVAIQEQLNSKRALVKTLKTLSAVLREQGEIEKAISTLERIIAIEEELKNQERKSIALTDLAEILHQKGHLLREQKQLDKAKEAFKSSYDISEKLGNQKSSAISLNNIGRILELQRQWEEAEQILKRSQDICADFDDTKPLIFALTTLSRVLINQQKWNEAEKILRQCYNLSTKEQDQRGQAIILNSLGGVLHKQGGEEKHKLALMFFQESIKLGEQLGDQEHLAKVYTAMGKTLLAHGNLEEAVIQLIKGLEIDKNLKNETGLTIVTSYLTRALLKLGIDEARIYCKKALAIAPNHPTLLNLAQHLTPLPRQNTKPILKQRRVLI